MQPGRSVTLFLGVRSCWVCTTGALSQIRERGFLTAEEREQIEELIQAFDDHGCGIGLDVQAQVALRRLLEAEAERALEVSP